MLNSEKMIEKIKLACYEKNIKIADLEAEVGLSKGNLSRWAKSCPSSIIILAKISEILNISTDYILNTEYIKEVEKGRNSKLNKLLNQMNRGEVVWQKILYYKAKKIPIINCINEISYNSNILAYETKFSNTHLIFLHYNLEDKCELFIEQNNEYVIICDNDSYAEQIYYTITSQKNDIINNFFESK